MKHDELFSASAEKLGHVVIIWLVLVVVLVPLLAFGINIFAG